MAEAFDRLVDGTFIMAVLRIGKDKIRPGRKEEDEMPCW